MKSGLASGLNAQAEYVLELQYHTQRNYGAGNVAVEGSVIEAFSDMAPGVAPAVRQPNRAAAPRGYAPGEGTTANPL